MNIKGIHKTSLIDYPGKISSILFTGGCNLRCKFCHNPELACNSCELHSYSNDEAIDFLRQRKGLIDGITISGGEPTLSRNLGAFINKIRDLKLNVKLDTNGLNPLVVTRLLEEKLVDYIAIDIKTSPEKYDFLAGCRVDFSKIVSTIDAVRMSGIDYELRTTCIPLYVTLDDFHSIRKHIGKVRKYCLQQFVNDVTLDESFHTITPYPPGVLFGFKKYVETFATKCEVRGV
jgi:pyruvate formate lyase activating enzyme